MAPYKGIPDILDAQQFSEGADTSLMNSLGKVLDGHGVSDVLGICLLHTHFDLAFDEVLVEKMMGHSTVSTPVRVDSIAGPLHPIVWRTSDGGAVPLHWGIGRDPHRERITDFINGKGGRKFMTIVGAECNRLGLIRASDSDKTRLLKGDVLMEETDVDGRKLISHSVPAKTVTFSSIQTAWFFSASQCGLARECRTVCLGGKDGHGPRHVRR